MLLFCAAFGAATLLPLQSEAVLVGVLLQDDYPVYIVVLMASLGNVSAQNMLKAQKIYQKYGYWSLFLSWLPIIGDPITLIAGLLKENFWRFLCIVSVAKFERYLFVYLAFSLF